MTGPDWWPAPARARLAEIRASVAGLEPPGLRAEVARLAAENARIHDRDCLNLNPAANVMAPAAERLMAAGLGTRPSLGLPGAKYEMGLEAAEAIETIAADLAARVFRARFAEVRALSGAMANLMAFMATARPGDTIVVPPASVAGHVTHHAPGAAGLYGLRVVEAPVDAARYTVDVAGLAALVRDLRPVLVTLGASLNLAHHPVAEVAEIAHAAGARLLFDAAHLSGPIAGGAWPDPLAEGADLMTMSTYKSLAGPPGGLVLTNDAGLAERLDRIAFPGLTANADVARVAALAVTLADWAEQGADHAAAQVGTARALAAALAGRQVPVVEAAGLPSRSHAFAIDARAHGGGTALAHRLRRAGLLASAIGLPVERGGDAGLRLGTCEIVRRGMGTAEMPALADLIVRAMAEPPEAVAAAVAAFRAPFTGVAFAGA